MAENYLTCNELISKYPMTKLWKWSPSKVGVFYRCLLLDGRTFGPNKRIEITERSFEDLMNYVINLNGIEDDSDYYLSYDEILEEIPQCIYYRWSPTIIGILRSANLLKGKRSRAEARNLIKKTSVIGLIEYTHQRFINISNL